MADNFQSIQSGQGELKNFYSDDMESTYEAIRKRRRKKSESLGLENPNDDLNRDKVPDPETK